MAPLALVCGLATLALSGGCQLIMDDIAPRSDDAGHDASSVPGLDAGPDEDADADVDADATVTSPDDAQSDGAEDVAPSFDGSPDADAEPDAAPDAARDTGLPEPDPDACDGAGERVFYRDSDGDGHGDPHEPRIACEAPADYVEDDGDCDDGNEDVFPGQTEYFGAGYEVPGSSVPSFDYDCDDQESSAPGQTQFQQCSSGLLGCAGGDSYRPRPDRAGSPNPFCGSDVKVTCEVAGVLGMCGQTDVVSSQAFLCR